MEAQNKKSTAISVTRREAIALLGGTAVAGVSGCCELRSFPKPQIPPTAAAFTETAATGFLAPQRINTRGVPTPECVDTHAHFFNASDVTIKGYLEGPVAYSMGGVLGELVKSLAPIADAFGEIAPSASAEFGELSALSALTLSDADRRQRVIDVRQREREAISKEFGKLIRSSKGRAFRQQYERLMQPPPGIATTERRTRIRQLDEESLLRAMQTSEAPVDESTVAAFAASDRVPYAEGILAFVGYMMSSRHSNLLTYQAAFTEENSTIGVRRTLGALVDFDRWLACAPRSAHEDQMRLHLKLSEVSRDYMLPVISYNPWTDIEESERSLALVEQAVKAGFVAVKIYPPNGFRPWGNAGFPTKEGPSGKEIDAALRKFWRKCQELNVPVLGHAGPSMGRDAYHNGLSGPEEWQRLLDAEFWSGAKGPRVSLGHFGGDDLRTDWTSRFAHLMAKPRGQHVYADLGYWEGLQCASMSVDTCNKAKARLGEVLDHPLDGNETVADRVMYGSDWLMLSREKNWPSYAQQLVEAIREVNPGSVRKIFGQNAKNCFGTSLRFT